MSQEMNDGYYEAYWPRAARQGRAKPLAKRLDTLDGKTVVQIWDYMFKGDEVFAALEAAFKTRYPNIKWVHYSVLGSSHGANEKEAVAAFPQRLKELGADAVISGMAC